MPKLLTGTVLKWSTPEGGELRALPELYLYPAETLGYILYIRVFRDFSTLLLWCRLGEIQARPASMSLKTLKWLVWLSKMEFLPWQDCSKAQEEMYSRRPYIQSEDKKLLLLKRGLRLSLSTTGKTLYVVRSLVIPFKLMEAKTTFIQIFYT